MKITSKYILITGITSLLSTTNAEVNKLEAIQVFGQGVEATSTMETTKSKVETVDSESIEQTMASSLDDALRTTPFANTTGGPRGSSEALQIRGLKNNKIFVYIDGAKQKYSNAHSNLTPIDMDNVKTIEIHKSSASYDQVGSLGGGAKFTTKDASDFLSPGKKAGVLYKTESQSSNDEITNSLKAFSNVKGHELLLTATQRNAEDTVLANRETLDNSAYEDKSALFKYGTTIKDNHNIKLSSEIFERKESTPLNPTLNPPKDLKNLNGDVQITRKTHRLSHTYRPFNNTLKSLSSTIYITDQINEKVRQSDKREDIQNIRTLGLNVSPSLKVDNVSFNGNVQATEDKLSGTRNGEQYALYPSGRLKEFSTSMNIIIPVGDIIEVSPGVRFQNYDLTSSIGRTRKDKVMTKKGSVAIRPFEWIEMSTTYSEGFNSPKIQEVFADGLHHKGRGFMPDTFFVPNFDLKHETSKTWENSLKIKSNLLTEDDQISLEYSSYKTDATDYIHYSMNFEFDPMQGLKSSAEYSNIQDVDLEGQEIVIRYLNERVDFMASYTETRGYNNFEDKFISEMPADQFTFNARYFLDEYGMSIGYLGVLTQKQDRVNSIDDMEMNEETPGYFVHDLYMTKNFNKGLLKGLDLNARVNNVTNRRYRRHTARTDEVGKDFKFGFSYKYEFL